MKTVLKLLLVTGLIGVFMMVGCAPHRHKPLRPKPRPHLKWRWHADRGPAQPAIIGDNFISSGGAAGVTADLKA